MVLVLFASLVLHGLPIQAAGSGYAVIDAQTGRLLEGVNPHAQLPIASLTKMWTALVVIENSSDLQEKVVISQQAVASEGSSIYLEVGDEWTIEELLYGLLLRSGNDAAYALAEHVGGSKEGFVHLMNEKALFYGLTNTNFDNPSGLHAETHLSSAYDTARMLQIAMKNPDFRRIASTKIYKGTVAWQNKHRLLHSDIGAVAGKTGYTKVAGRTLATYFEREQKKFVVVTINEGNDWNVHKSLAQKVDNGYEVVTLAKKGNYSLSGAKVKLNEPISLLLKREEVKQIQHVVHLSRNEASNTAIWHVFLQNRVIFSKRVERK